MTFDPWLCRRCDCCDRDRDRFDRMDTVSSDIISRALAASLSAWLIGRIFFDVREEIGRMLAEMMFRFCPSLSRSVSQIYTSLITLKVRTEEGGTGTHTARIVVMTSNMYLPLYCIREIL